MKKPRQPLSKKSKRANKPAEYKPFLSSVVEVIKKGREMDPAVFGEELRSGLWALSSCARLLEKGRNARIELLETAIWACNLLGTFDDDDFKDIAPLAKGWPVVLAGTKERARDWKKAQVKIKKLQAGARHPSRFTVESVGEFGSFVDHFMGLALFVQDIRQFSRSGGPKMTTQDVRGLPKLADGMLVEPAFGINVTMQDVQGLPKLAEGMLVEAFGKEWQNHPGVFRIFAKNLCRIGDENKPWEECSRWQKRQFVRDKFKGAARTYRAQLARFGKT